MKQQPCLEPRWINSHAYGIVKALQKKGFTTYLVGGCVRDLLLGIRPKDFDIATDATPEDIHKIIHKSYIIGKRFRLVLVKRQDQQIEVSTFRRNPRADDKPEDLPEGDNIFGSSKEDSVRRDFTVNALFYDPIKNELIDFIDGQKDLAHGVVRMIGDPDMRLEEDPVRILRALRLSHKVGFALEPGLKKSMQEKAHTLETSALPRRREEYLKLLRLNNPALAFQEMHDLGLNTYILPSLEKIFSNKASSKIFLSYLQRFPLHAFDPKNAEELFGVMIFAYLHALEDFDLERPIKTKAILDNKKLVQFMKFELGMFNHEQTNIAKALYLRQFLTQMPSLSDKPKRLMAIMSSASFLLALKLAQLDHLLSGHELLSWEKHFNESLEEIIGLENKKARKKRRRHHKKR